jgi:hypothetical protein
MYTEKFMTSIFSLLSLLRLADRGALHATNSENNSVHAEAPSYGLLLTQSAVFSIFFLSLLKEKSLIFNILASLLHKMIFKFSDNSDEEMLLLVEINT